MKDKSFEFQAIKACLSQSIKNDLKNKCNQNQRERFKL